MPILKNKTQGKYVNVYKGIAMDRSLSLRDRGMMLTLLSLPDNWEFTIAGLGKILPDGKAAIHASLKSLQNAGYLSKNQSRNDKGIFGENIIEVYETPNTPFPDFRQTDNPVTEKPVPDYQPQLNNNKVINQETNINVSTNHSIYQDLEMDVMDSMETYMDIVKRNIEYISI